MSSPRPEKLSASDESQPNILRQARVVSLLSAAQNAGIAPLTTTRLHQLAYLTNALAPVWDLVPLTSELLKHYGSPYDASLQFDVDRLVGAGLVVARDLHYYEDVEGHWKATAKYSLNSVLAEPLLAELLTMPDEVEINEVAKEICLAVSGLPPDRVDDVLALDVAYSNPSTSANALLELYDNHGANATSRAASQFSKFSPSGLALDPAQQANLYIRHLYRIASHAA